MFSVRPRVILEKKNTTTKQSEQSREHAYFSAPMSPFQPAKCAAVPNRQIDNYEVYVRFNGKVELISCLFDQVKTDNQNLTPQQNAVARLIVKPFDAENGPLIMVRQLTHGKVTLIVRSTLSDLKFKIFLAVNSFFTPLVLKIPA